MTAPKYKVTRTDGTPVPPGEPVFAVRGQDAFAVKIIQAYIDMTKDVVDDVMTTQLTNLRREFEEYRLHHRVKLPD